MKPIFNIEITSYCMDQIPLIVVKPTKLVENPRLVIWLSWLGGTKEDALPYLRSLAEEGFVALSFDAFEHGERGTETSDEISRRVFGQFRRQMWPILGQTVQDTTRVIDWAIQHLNVLPEVYMGGISMGGDISVAAAGADRRIRRVAAMVATPDWLRPGMRDIFDPQKVLDQGEADPASQFCYDWFNPLTHLGAYDHGPEILLECAAADTHVPPDGALRFQAALKRQFPQAGENVKVNLIPNCGHLDSKNPQFWADCLKWFNKK